jgi:hypothetical protein
MDDNKPFDLGKRDLHLAQINKQIAAKEQLLRSKEDELLKKGKDNEYLKNVYDEYKIISTQIQNEKEKLIIAMKKIIQHLDDIVKNNNKLSKKDLSDIHEEKNIIVKIINRLTKELEELIKVRN